MVKPFTSPFFCLLSKPAKAGPFPWPKQHQRAQDSPSFLLLLGTTPFALYLKHSSSRLPLPLLFFPKTIPQRRFPLSPAKAFPSFQPQNKPKPAIFNFWSHSRQSTQILSLSHQPSPALPHTCQASLLSAAHLSATVISRLQRSLSSDLANQHQQQRRDRNPFASSSSLLPAT